MTVRAAEMPPSPERLDRAGNGGGRILTGWELALGRYGIRGATPAPLERCLGQPGRRRCGGRRREVAPAKVAPLRPLGRSVAAVGLLWAAGGRAGGLSAGPGLDAMGPLPAALGRRAAVLAEQVHDRPRQRQGSLRQRVGDPRRGRRRTGRTIGTGPRVGPRPGTAAADVSRSQAASGGRCWPRWSNRPTISSAPIAPAAKGTASTSSPCR